MKPRWRYQFYLDRLGRFDPWRLLVVEVLFAPRDLWLGLYWTKEPVRFRDDNISSYKLHLYLCLIPCLPLHVMLRRYQRRLREEVA